MVMVKGGGVNWVDKKLGQPKWVMTAGMHGPSGQLIFDIKEHKIICTCEVLTA